jgi:hypothetical protein
MLLCMTMRYRQFPTSRLGGVQLAMLDYEIRQGPIAHFIGLYLPLVIV